MASPDTERHSADWYNATGADAADTLETFKLDGGTYAIEALAATWGGGSVDLHKLGPDGATYYSVLGTLLTQNEMQVGELPIGTYKFVITTTNGLSLSITRIARRG